MQRDIQRATRMPWKRQMLKSEYQSRTVFFVLVICFAIILDAAVFAAAGLWPAIAAAAMWALGAVAWSAVCPLEREDRAS